ncbi:DHA2 family efflux MFS transporter permease subunit [Loigolactobacillus jiayinensis]|uniref:DHA2 family efflux MFS transporter permease subunit n=1 Tax=Loigolactobacillus jiayinensis TaxID=2486016 RepID=A0ABW1RCK9_9LACO|nr:DHA2 family efflux MFS transporter permease subunit [Loigolactobacillus jiayinensis]
MTEKISPRVLGAVLATGLMSFCGVIVETAMNITFPTLMREFHVSTALVQWMTTIYLLTVAIMVPLSALLKKRFRTKTLFLVANLLFIAGLALDAFATEFPVLLLGRVVQGLGTGIALPLMFNIILEQVPLAKIGFMMGIGTLITAIAPAIGPTFGGIVVSTLGWRYIFAFLLPILLISLIIGLKCIQQKSDIQRVSFDVWSVLLVAVTFAGLIIGFSNMGSQPLFSWIVGDAFIIGLLSLIGLVWRSLHLTTPIINLRVLGNGDFAGHALSFFLIQITALGLSFILPNYIQLVNQSSATAAGLVVLPGALLGAIFAPFSGRILDRLGAKKPLLVGSTLALVAMLLLSIFSRHLSDGLIIAFYLIFMAGVGLAYGNIMTNGLKLLPAAQHADGNAIFNTIQQFAGAVGTAVVAAIIGQSQNNTAIKTTVATAIGSQHAFYFLLTLLVIELLVLGKVILWPLDKSATEH